MSIFDVLGDILATGTVSSPRSATRLSSAISGGNPYARGGRITPAPPWQSRSTGGIGSGLKLPPRNQLQEMIEELQRLQDPNRYAADPALLERQAYSAAAAQYDPITAALRGQASTASARANRNQQQLGSMYEGLSQSLLGDIAPIQQQYSNTQQKAADQYKQLQDQITQQYASSQSEQEAMLKRLNIEAAVPEATSQQRSDRDFLVSSAATEGQNLQSQLTQQGTGAVDYTRQGSQIARTEGTNRQADLMANLSQYLNEIQGQIGANEAAKSAAAIANLGSLQQDSQKYATSRAQQDFENYAKVISLMNTLQGGQDDIGPAKSPVDVGPRSMSLGLTPASAQQIQSVFMEAISNDPLIIEGVNPTSGLSLTKEALARRIVEQGRNSGLSSQQLNALQQIALEYFGRQ